MSAVSYNKLKVTVCFDSTSSTNDQGKFESASYDPIKMRFPLNNYAHQLKVYSNFILKIILSLMKQTSYHGLYQASRFFFKYNYTQGQIYGGALYWRGSLKLWAIYNSKEQKPQNTNI